jgi:hypothetical protein
MSARENENGVGTDENGVVENENGVSLCEDVSILLKRSTLCRRNV